MDPLCHRDFRDFASRSRGLGCFAAHLLPYAQLLAGLRPGFNLQVLGPAGSARGTACDASRGSGAHAYGQYSPVRYANAQRLRLSGSSYRGRQSIEQPVKQSAEHIGERKRIYFHLASDYRPLERSEGNHFSRREISGGRSALRLPSNDRSHRACRLRPRSLFLLQAFERIHRFESREQAVNARDDK